MELPRGEMGAARPGREEDMVLMGSIEEMPGTKADMVDAGAGKEDERLRGGVGLVEYGVEFPRNGGSIPLLLALEVAWSMERWDMVVAGEEWKDGCESAGVVAAIGERLLANVAGIWCML